MTRAQPAASEAPYAVRRYRPADRPGFLSLYEDVWGRPKGEAWFKWRFERNPYADGVEMVLAECDGRIVGAEPLLPLRLTDGTERVAAYQPVDWIVHPDHRRRGLFTRMTERLLEAYADRAALFFNFPSEALRPGLEKFDWTEVGPVATRYRVQRPGRAVADTKRPTSRAVSLLARTSVPAVRAGLRVADRLTDLGGQCRRSRAGSPEKLVATVLAGTTAQLRDLADALASEGLGLRRLASQLERRLDPDDPSGEGLGPITDDGTAVMGILNVTPDSFHDGGEYEAFEAAVERAAELIDAGADVIDIGGESTRPGAEPVPVETEIDRVVPVIEALSAEYDVSLSVDTRKAAVADAALEAGADIVNDVSGLADPEMPFVVAEHDAALVLMHSLSVPVDPDRESTYDDVVEDVTAELSEQLLRAERAGIDRERIVVDPGCGFGKSPAESFELIDRLGEFEALGCPVLIGHSRKSMFAAADDADDGRLTPTIAGTAIAADRGADVIRVHDVAENVAAVKAATGRLEPEK